MSIILSIKPKYVELIYSGKKTLEMRKSVPKKCVKSKHVANGDIYTSITTYSRVYMCESGTGGIITGHFTLDIIQAFSFNISTAFMVKEVVKGSCLEWAEICDYYKGAKYITPWTLKDVVKYDTPRHISELGINRAPQSWCYTKGVDLA